MSSLLSGRGDLTFILLFDISDNLLCLLLTDLKVEGFPDSLRQLEIREPR